MRAKIPKSLWRLPLPFHSPYFNFMLLLFWTTIFVGLILETLVEARLHRRAQELYEVRVFEGAPIGTKATLNEAFDRALREMNSCFAQLESDLDWLDFDSDRLFFQTVAELPQNSSRPAQFAVLHLLCPQHKHSLHFSVHITRRNRHAPKFLSNDYRFYAPVNLPIGSEIGKVQVQDQDPIIYNSQVQLSIVRSSSPGAFGRTNNGGGISSQSKSADLDEDPFWEIARNGSIIVRRRLGELRLFRPYQLRLLAIDFGSPQLFSLTNVTIVPVSVSQPQNVRVNIANTRYQVFQWELPVFGVPEQFRLTLRRKGELRPIYEGELEPTETMAMTRIRLPIIAQMEVSISAVDVDGETPSEGVPFQALESELLCEGQCAGADAGLPMCHYSQTHQLEQFRDAMGQRHCLCFAGFSGAQCDRIEHCPSERLLEHYGGVDWPETAVNQSAGIPCPYNDDGRRLERKCGWNAQREEAHWANATNAIGGNAEGKILGGSKGGQSKGNGLEVGENDGHCRTQSSVLVHLGVLANYGQRSEQTLSGLHSVMRFLNTLLQFPAFQPQIPSAHFDAKIAEHVAQVLDSLAARNLSSLTGGGNSTQLSGQVAEYAKEFARQLPVPFSLQSASGGLQMRAWDLLPSAPTAADTLNDPIAGNGQGGVQLGPCFVQPPSQPRPRTARAICLRNATLFPLLNGHSPLLMLQIDDGRRKSKLNGSEQRMEGQSQQQQEGPIVLGFRLPKTTIMPSKQLENFTCAQFDQQAQLWSASGIALLSREFRPHGQILLCEVDSMIGKEGIFALLPESMFRPESALLVWFAKYGTALGAVLTMVICLALLLSSAFLHRNSDPALLVLLLSLLLLHLFHFVFLLRPQLPQLPFGIPWPPSSSALFSALQLALLSFVASMALINSSIYTRIVHLELEIRKAQSRGTRLLLTLLFTILLPLALCVLTSLLDGQILIGLDSDAPQLQPFNWTFGLALLLPLVLFMGCAMGFGAYSFWYGNKLASSSSSSSDWPMESASIIQRRLLHQLSCAGGLSWLVLIFPLANLLALLLPPEPISSLVLCVLYFFTALFLLLFVRLLARIHRRLPYARENITNGIEQGPRALRENTLVAPLDEKGGRNGGGGFGGGRNGTHQHGKQQPVLIIQEQGQAQPIAPGEVLDPNNNSNNTLGSPMTDQGLDRQFLLRRAIHPAQLQSQPPLLLIGTQFRQQLGVPSASNQQRLSGTVSTSAGTVLLESDDLASLDRAIAAQTQLVPMQNSTRNLPANLFAEMDGDEEEDDDDEDEEDLDAFLEPHCPTMGGEMSLRPPQQKQRKRPTNGPTSGSPNNLAHPLVSVV